MSDQENKPEFSRRLTLINKRGLHARASNKFVALACAYDAIVTVEGHNGVSEEAVVADSIMEVLMLGAACGEEITITTTGIEAEQALTALTQLVQSAFGEGE